LQWTPLLKILNRKIKIIDFQNPTFDAKSRLKKRICIEKSQLKTIISEGLCNSEVFSTPKFGASSI